LRYVVFGFVSDNLYGLTRQEVSEPSEYTYRILHELSLFY